MKRKLLLACGSTLLALLVLELVLRQFAPPVQPGVATADAPNSSRYGWALPPRTWMSVADPDTGRLSYFRTNSRGWKDREHTLAKPADTFRIVVLGDSYTYGVVPLDQQYTTRLEALLHERGWPDCEVISLGVSGWGTDQALEALVSEGLAYQPDLVLYQFCSNDLLENLHPEPDLPLPTPFHRIKHFRYVLRPDGTLAKVSIPVKPRHLSIGQRLRRASGQIAIVNLLDRALHASRKPKTKALDGATALRSNAIDPASPYFLYAQGDEPAGTRHAWELLDALIRRMRDEARRQGAEFVVFSESGDAGRRRWFLDQGLIRPGPEGDVVPIGDSSEPVDLQRPLKDLARLCEAAGIPLIRPTRSYTRYHHDSHTNAEGNARMAADIADFLNKAPRLAASSSPADVAR